MFDAKSRYGDAETYSVIDRNGREVEVVAIPSAKEQSLLGLHLRKQGQRLDHLAAKYLDDPAGFWRIAEMANVMLPDALRDEQEIPIPRRSR